MSVFQIILRSALSIVFVWAAIVKIVDPRSFLDAVYSYRLLPDTLAVVVAPDLSGLAASLWTGKFSRSASGMLAILCLNFLGALIQAWLRGINI